MKKFIVTIELSHESFGGYDHKDGTETYEVDARNEASARKKAMKLSKNKGGGYSRQIVGCERCWLCCKIFD